MSTPRWIAVAILAFVCVGCLGCRGRDATTRAAAGRDGAPGGRDASAVAAIDAGAAARAAAGAAVNAPVNAPVNAIDDVASLRREGESLLARWLDVQNKGDVTGYQALYEPRHFRGIKRTSAGKVKTLD